SESDMTVFLVVYDKESYCISEKLFSDITSFIDDVYVGETMRFAMAAPMSVQLENTAPDLRSKEAKGAAAKEITVYSDCEEYICESDELSLDEMIKNIDEGFALTLLRLIDAKGVSEVECYKKANVSKQTWHKIMNDKSYRPSKNTVISFAIALELTLSETRDLLERVGYALSRSSKFDIIIEYFISRGIYDIFEIDETLFKFDQVTLGS
ncbi:MAG: helix-turn-helix domain-containing protein, partial [Clostridia bacterium]|nr:helix-turn-helix domain-containing protein [Clostridia bacterium]